MSNVLQASERLTRSDQNMTTNSLRKACELNHSLPYHPRLATVLTRAERAAYPFWDFYKQLDAHMCAMKMSNVAYELRSRNVIKL